MIINAFAVLDAFVLLLRGCTALLVIGLGCIAWRAARLQFAGSQEATTLEGRFYLLFLLAFLLLGLNLVSWPLLYLLLQSYVPQWPGVMCIYGVTQIGAGSQGASRWLPDLVATLQWLKPATVFLSGAWLVLYRINRQTRAAPLTRRVISIQILLGVVALADTTVEAAYLAIPKQEEFLSSGCCTAVFDDRARGAPSSPQAIIGVVERPWIVAAYFAVQVGMALAILAALRRRQRLATLPLAMLLLGAIVAIPVTAAFLTEVAAPTVLHLPYHHCPYDLIPSAPDMVFGIALFAWGSFSVGWANLAQWLATHAEARAFADDHIRKILTMALYCYLGSLILTSLALALA